MKTNEIRNIERRYEMMKNLCNQLGCAKENLVQQHSRLEAIQIDSDKFIKNIHQLTSNFITQDSITKKQCEDAKKSLLETKQNVKDLTEILRGRNNPHYYLYLRFKELFLDFIKLIQSKTFGNASFKAIPYRFINNFSPGYRRPSD